MAHLCSRVYFTNSPRTPYSSRGSSETCRATYCNSLPPHTRHCDQDLNTFFQSLLNEPFLLCLLTAEHTMLEIYSTVNRHMTQKLNSQKSTFETTHLKQLPLNTFVIYTIFEPVKFSYKLKPLRTGQYKIIQHLSDVIYGPR